VFIHGIATSSYLWRKVIARVDGDRRCIAMDLPLHGQTPARPGQDLSLGGLGGFVGEVCDALGLDTFDLVANDTGGALEHFDRRWASWLRDIIPAAREVVDVPGGRWFFPDERPDELVSALRAHWHAAGIGATSQGLPR
jgi:pimeloyl-ACP methyl ester carboxylesterase